MSHWNTSSEEQKQKMCSDLYAITYSDISNYMDVPVLLIDLVVFYVRSAINDFFVEKTIIPE